MGAQVDADIITPVAAIIPHGQGQAGADLLRP